MNTEVSILPYSPEYEPALLDLERRSAQGSWIQMEMIRDCFLSRSIVFENYRVFLGLSKNEKLAGVTAGAIVLIECNNKLFKVGVGYDLKVSPDFRKQGLAKEFGRQLVENYFLPSGVQDFFVTMKTSNIAVAKSCYTIQRTWYQYEFLYLTIPTWSRIKKIKKKTGQLKFKTKLFSNDYDLSNYFIKMKSGLGIWKTYEMYQIKLKKLNPVVKVGRLVGNIFLSKHRQIPGKGELLKFATLFDFDSSNFFEINEALEYLQNENIQYLNVCCQKGDFVWQTLKALAINAYPYTMLGTFETKPESEISIDVRCL